MKSAGRIVAIATCVLALAGCDRGTSGPADEASARRLAEISSQVDADLASLKSGGCTDPAAQRLKGLATELASRHHGASETQSLLREIMQSSCPGVQAETVVAMRGLRPSVAGRVLKGDLAEALFAGLSATDAMVRTLSAMTVYELHADPRSSRLPDMLKKIAASDPDEKARATAMWVLERLNTSFPPR